MTREYSDSLVQDRNLVWVFCKHTFLLFSLILPKIVIMVMSQEAGDGNSKMSVIP